MGYTMSGLGTPGTTSITTLIDVYRRPGGPNLPDDRFRQALARAALRQRSNGNTGPSAPADIPTMVYNLAPINGVTMPKITLIGGTSVDLELADRIISGIRSNRKFRDFMGEMAAANPLGVFIVMEDLLFWDGAGGQAQSDVDPTTGVRRAGDGQFEAWVRSTEQTGATTDQQQLFRRYNFARAFIHELYHLNNIHPVSAVRRIRSGSDQAGLDALIQTDADDIRRTLRSDDTYVDSDEVFIDMFGDGSIFGFESGSQFRDQVKNDRERAAPDYYITRRKAYLVFAFDAILEGRWALTLSPDQLEQLRDDGIIRLKRNGNRNRAADHEVTPGARAVADAENVRQNNIDNAFADATRALEAELGRVTPPAGDSPPEDQTAAETFQQVWADVVAKRAREKAGQVGYIFGSTLGNHLGKGNVFAEVTLSAVLGTVGENIAEVIFAGGIMQKLPSRATQSVIADFDDELFANLKAAGIGAVSSFLTAELVKGLGLDGLAGELTGTLANTVISQVLENIATRIGGTSVGLFEGIDPLAIGNAVGAFVGTKLASLVVKFDTVGGQLGSSIGAAVGVLAAKEFLAIGGALGGPIGAAIGAFVGFIVGGFVGSVFGGTPRAGADVAWDASTGRFAVTNVYSRKGGSKDAARGMADAVGGMLNAVVDILGGELEDGSKVQSGNYGMRGSKYVYRPTSTRDKDAITRSFKGKTGAVDLVNYGAFVALSDPDFTVAGGNIYAKRAFYNSLSLMSEGSFNAETLFGNINIGTDYSRYAADSFVIQTLMAADPNNAFSSGWLVTIAAAQELGVTKRHASDWFGGWSKLLEDNAIAASNLDIKFIEQAESGKLTRYSVVFDEADKYRYHFNDTVLTSDIIEIDGTSGADVIQLTHSSSALVRGGNLVGQGDWPAVGSDVRGENLIDLDGWPVDPLTPPSGAATVSGWQNPAQHLDETQWSVGQGPFGTQSVLMRAGQIDASQEGGGNFTNAAPVDPTKAYEHVYYFQLTELGTHALRFGLGGAAVQSLATGVATADPYFLSLDAAEQSSLHAAGKLAVGKWYKVVGYVLPSDAAAVPSSELGGVFSVETGEKIADVDSNYRWDPAVPASGASAHARFFSFDGTGSPGWSANFYKPELREIDSSAYVPEGFARPQGWQDLAGVTNETRWAKTVGPNGKVVVALQAGQADGTPEGGGAHTGEVSIDGQRAYEFTFYFKKPDLSKHSINFGLDQAAAAYVENAATGADDTNPYFVAMDAATQQALLQNDRWYKVVGYVLAEGAALPATGSMGGVFDTVTGQKVASATTFRWNPGRPDNSVHARFFNSQGHDQAPGYSTYFYQPGIREISEQQVVGGADRLSSTAGLKINGIDGDGFALSIPIAATIDAGDGDDRVHGGDMGNNVVGGAGNDVLYGGRLDDWLLGGDGNDSLNAGSESSASLGGDGNYLVGGAGDDLLIGREGSDWLEGGFGTDTLEGGDGDDVLAGGAGFGDMMRGGRGNDQYIFRPGDVGATEDIADADVVRDESGLSVETVVRQAYNDRTAPELLTLVAEALSGALFRSGRGLGNWHGGGIQTAPDGKAAGGEDVLVFGTGIGLEDVRFSKSEDDPADLLVEIWPDGGPFTGDRLVLDDWFSSFNKIEIVRFADGNEIRIADFDTFILGTEGSETIVGTAGHDFVHAGAGEDFVYLLSGNDFGNGGLGNDSVAGDGGDDIVVGADGDDALEGGAGNDLVSGGRGDDFVSGWIGHDVLAGGAGNDELVGGAGDDVFKFVRGDGRDTFIDALTDEWEKAWISGPGWQNGYVLNPDGTIGHAIHGTLFDGKHWLAPIRYDVETGTLWRHRPASADATVADSGADSIEFGIGIDINDIQFARANGDRDIIVGIEPSGTPSPSFAALADQILLREWGAAGNAAAHGSIESFVFFNTGVVDVSPMRLDGGTDGNDSLTGIAGTENWITGGAGDDQVTGQALGDILNGNSGQDRLLGNGGDDVLLGGVDNDVLIGGAGGDLLIGGSGTDVASYETAAAAVAASLAAPKAAGDASAGEAAGDSYDGVEGLRGSSHGDTLDGDDGANDLQGGKGNDTVRGALGDDTYIFGRGDGFDTIEDQHVAAQAVVVDGSGQLERPYVSRMNLLRKEGSSFFFEHVVEHADTGDLVYRRVLPSTLDRDLAVPTTFEESGWIRDDQGNPIYTVTGSQVAQVAPEGPAGTDTILFEDYTGVAGYVGEQAIGLSDLTFAFDSASPNDLLISLVGSSTDQVRIRNFRNGAALDADRAVEIITFSDGSSVQLAGLKFNSSGALLLSSSDTPAAPAEDFIVGTAGGETLVGGYGADTLSGLDGIDILQGGEGDDQLSGGLGADSLQGGEGVDTITYLGSDAGVTVNLQTGAAGVGGEAQGDTFSAIENVVGTHFSDSLVGNASDNIIKGNRGNDSLSGGLGADVVLGDDGVDSISGNQHDDYLDGGAGNDTLSGGGDRDIMSGGEGNDVLRGDGVSGNESGGNQIVNFGFESSGTTSDDATQSYGITTTDLPGWTVVSGRPVQLTTSASGVNPSEGTRAVHLDDGTGNVEIRQKIVGLTAGENLTLLLSSAGRTTNSSSSFEVLWNGTVVLTVASGTATMTTRAAGLTAIEGENVLSIRGTGAVDGLGAVIDNVRLSRSGGAADQLAGGAGSDRLEGGAGNDSLFGGDGDDHSSISLGTVSAGLYGGSGDDILDGGAGNDTLDGQSGNDSYIFRANSGNDTVVVSGGVDALIFDGLSKDGLWFSQVAGTQDMLITAIGSNASVRVTGWFASDGNQARRIEAADAMLARSDVAALVAAMAAESPAVPTAWPAAPSQAFKDALAAAWQAFVDYVDRAVVRGTTGDDGYLGPNAIWVGPVRYEALEGNDFVSAGGTDDVIIGGAGNDMMFGGAGDDEFQFASDEGFDSIDGMEGDDDRLVAAGDGARINLQSLSNVERISAAGYDDLQINLAAGAALDLSNVEVDGVDQINGADADESIIGSASDDRILAGYGADVVRGGDGDDFIQGGDGNDDLDGGSGRDTLDQSSAIEAQTIDLVAGEAATASSYDLAANFEDAIGGSADDTILGTSGENLLDGNAGSDILEGGAGDDTLIGGADADILRGGAGSDTASYRTQAAPSAVTSVVNGLTLNGVVVNLAASTSGDGATPPAALGAQGDAEGDWFYQVENLEGSGFNDSLTGDGAANRLAGGGGDDLLEGGGGMDTVVYAGNRADYEVDTVGSVKVRDVNASNGDDGLDTLTGVEKIEFADVTVSLGIDPNNNPRLGDPAMTDQLWNDGVGGTYRIPETSFLDLDLGDTLSFVATLADGSPLPSWLTFTPGTRTFHGTPPEAAIGMTLEIKVTASDSGYAVSDNFRLTVAQAPGATRTGTSGDDVMTGNFRDEILIGVGGDDSLRGLGGADRLDGGPGRDEADYSASAAGVGIDLTTGKGAFGDAEGDELISIERVRGSAFDDVVVGTADPNDFFGGAGADRLVGGAGDDLLDGEDGADTLIGGDGHDSIHVRALDDGSLEDVVDGGHGLDTLYLGGSAYAAYIDLGIEGSSPASIENVTGSDHDDGIAGNEFSNILSGGLGDDSLSGAGGFDTLYGGAGFDSLGGGTGDDHLYGEDGDDYLSGGSGADTLYGGAGTDTADYQESDEAVDVNLAASTLSGGHATGDVLAGGSIENVAGSQHGDMLRGSVGANVLWGMSGNDTIYGGEGDDSLDGGWGNDTLFGEAGIDWLSGGPGADILDGGLGADTLIGGEGTDDFILLVVGEDAVDGQYGIDRALFTGATGNLAIDLANAAHKLANIEEVFGGGGDDDIKGSSAANRLEGGAGNDVLEGRGGADLLVGGAGTDTASYASSAIGWYFGTGSIGGSASAGVAAVIRTLAGVDVNLAAGTGANAEAAGDTFSSIENLTGSAHGDRLRAATTATVIAGGEGDDLIYGGAGGDTLTGEGGHDIVYGEAGTDTLRGGLGDDRLFGGADNDLLYGGDGNDILSEEGGSGSDSFYGEAGNDLMLGSAAADFYDGGTGTDMLDMRASTAAVRVNLSSAVVNGLGANSGAGGDAEGDTYAAGTIENATGSELGDELSGGAGANELRGRGGADALTGGAGDDILRGDGGVDTLYGEAGIDQLYGGTENDLLYGGSESDTIYGDGGDDLLDGGLGGDWLLGGDGNDDFILLVVGEDMVDGGAGVDRVLFTAATANLTIDLTNGAHRLNNVEQVVGGGGSDIISGSAAANRLEGGAGDDRLEGRGGADALIGGLGVDTVSYASSAAGAAFGTGMVGVIPALGIGTEMWLNGVDVDLAAGTGANADAAGDTFSGIENLIGSYFGDRLRSGDTASIIYGGFGDDVLYGGAGNDTIYGDDGLGSNDGSDVIYGGGGGDTLRAGIGDDIVFGGLGDDLLYGGDGDDILSEEDGGGIDSFFGETGSDWLLGSVGADHYDGGADDDTLDMRASAAGVRVNLSSAVVNGVAANRGAGGDAEGDSYAAGTIENITGSAFADELTGSAAANRVYGGSGADWVSGGLDEDWLYGEAGADTLRGDEGEDWLYGGGEDDTLYGGSDDDNLMGDAGNDLLEGGTGWDALYGGDGNDDFVLLVVGEDRVDGGAGEDRALFTAATANLTVDLINAAHQLTNVEQVFGGGGSDSIKGSAAANRLDGGAGDDVLEGRGGADILVGGAGTDTASYASAAATGSYFMALTGGSASAGIADVARALDGLSVSLATGTGSGGDATGDSLSGIENLIGSGYSDSLSGTATANTINAGGGDDIVLAGAGNDDVWGDAGHDIIYGEAGADNLRGGLGDDRLFGGADNDILSGGDGNDILSEEGGGGSDSFFGEAGDDLLLGSAMADTYDGGIGTDTVDLRASAAAVQVNLSTVTVNGVVANRGAGGDAEGDTYAAGTIENVTGSAYADTLTGSTAANLLRGGAGNDTLTGGAGNDVLHGEAGADTVRGDAGLDTLYGGGEDDTLYGGIDNDTIYGDDGNDDLFGEDGADTLRGGLGNDELTGGLGADTLYGGDGNDDFHLLVVGEDVRVDGEAGIDRALFTASTAHLVVDMANAAHKLFGIEQVLTGSGNDQIKGTAGADRLEGNAGNDVLEGRGGADVLVGGDGIDTVTYAASAAGAAFSSGLVGESVVNNVVVVQGVDRTLNGVDVNLIAGTGANAEAAGDTLSGIENLIGSSSSDRLRGTDLSSTVEGGLGDDVVYGGAGNDILKGEGGDDIIYGEAGVDQIHGGDGNDRLFGGGESDSLYGGIGEDVLDAGEQGDRLEGGEHNDTLIGGAGADGYHVGRNTGADTIYNWDTDGSADSVVYSGVENTELWFSKVAGTRDLLVKVLGTGSSVTIKDWFANAADDDYTRGSDHFAVDMVVAGAFVADKIVNVPQLISIMAAHPEPLQFSDLDDSVEELIRQTWANNTPPTIAAVAGNPLSIDEEGTVKLRFTVDDNSQTPDASLTITAVSAGVLQTILPADIAVIDESTREVTVRAGTASGDGTVTVTAHDGHFSSAPLTVQLPVVAVADVPQLGLQPFHANAGATVEIDGTLSGAVIAMLNPADDEVFHSITIEGIPVGATLRSGTNSFTAAAGSTTATITSWALSTLQLVLPAGSSTDFSLTVRATSREPSNGAVSAAAVGTIAFTVNGTPTGVGFAYSVPKVNENASHASGLVVGTLTATDPGDATGSYTFTVIGTETARFMTVGNQLWLKPNISLNYEAGPITVGIRITDNSTGTPLTFDGSVSIQPADVNEAPTGLVDSNAAANSVAEGAAAGTAVGVTMSATDPEGGLTYSITNDPMNWFAINATTGVVTVRTGAVINYEATAAGTASINVQATDGVNPAISTAVTITIPDTNETPVFTSAASGNLLENSAGGTLVLTLTSSDPDKDTLSHGEAGHVYSIIGGTGSTLFELVSGNQLRTKAGTSFNYESGTTSYTLTLRVRDTNNTGLYVDQNFTVNIQNVNEAPTNLVDSNAAANSVAEGAAAGTAVGVTMSATDPEGGLTYSITNDPMNWFAINATTGVVTVRTGAVINYEATAAGTASINVQATDGVNPAISTAVTITIPDTNETPVFTSAASGNLLENSAGGTLVLTLTSSDPDKDTLSHGEAGHVYSIIGGTGSTLFELVSGNQLRTKAGTSFNYESGTTSYTLTLRVRDTNNTGLYADQNFTVNIQNVNEAPTNLVDSNAAANSVAEGAAAGTAVGVTMSATDPEGGLTYSITNDPMNWFAINATTGVVTVRTGAVINYEATADGTASINVQATDGVNPAISTAVTIAIADTNETPVFTSAASGNLLENSAAGTLVATLTSSDPDKDTLSHGEAGHVYSIIGGTGATLFELVSGNQLRTKAGTSFNYESGTTSYTLTLRVRDTNNTGLYVDQNFTVNIQNVNEAPTNLVDANAAANTVTEGATAGAATGITLSATDPEGPITYSITNDVFNWFTVDPNTGVMSVRTGATVNYETTNDGTVTINVQASDGVTSPATASVVIAIADVNETPVITSAAGASLSEAAGGGVLVASLSSTDPDRDAFAHGEAGHVWSVVGGTGATLFETVGTQLRTKAGATFNYDGGTTSYSVTLRVRDSNNTGLYADQNFTVTITNVDEAPGVPAAIADRYVNENAAFSVGLSGSVDPEGGEVTYEFSGAGGSGNPGSLFAIDNVAGTTGTLRLVAPIDFEWLRNQTFYTAETANRGYVAVRLLASDPTLNKSPERTIYVHFDNLNDNAPAQPALTAWGTTTFNENSGAGAVVATFAAPADADGSLNPLSFQLTSNPGGMFEVVGNQIRVISTANFNYEAFATGGASTSLSLGVRATDGSNVSGTYAFSVQLNNVDDNLPTAGGIAMQNGYSTTLTENTVTPQSGLVVARAQASDVDGDAVTYSIVSGNVASTFSIDGNGYISAPNGINFEGMGGASTYAVDASLTVNLTIRAAQVSNSGRYVDQVLTLTIADAPELTQIFDGSGLVYTHSSSPSFSTTGFAAGYAGARMWVGGWSALYFRDIILRDSNGDGAFTLGTDQTIYDRREDTGQVYVAAPYYRWDGTIPATGEIPPGIRFVQDLPPVVLDLNGDGLFNGGISVSFDVDGDGTKDRVGWISAGDAFLVLDRNADGQIDHGAELSFITDKPGANSDLEGLAAYDGNGDGVFDAADSRFGEFRVWQDSNQDGVSDAGELRSLAEAGIVSISLARTANPGGTPDTASQVLLGTSTFTMAGGAVGQVGDVALRWEHGAAAPAPKPLPQGAVVAIDGNGDGLIDPATEATGPQLPLEGFDSNGDGLITSQDERYYDLRLWTDSNDNGRAEPDELTGLDRAGLGAISALAPAAAPPPPTVEAAPAPQTSAPANGPAPASPAAPDAAEPVAPPAAAAPAEPAAQPAEGAQVEPASQAEEGPAADPATPALDFATLKARGEHLRRLIDPSDLMIGHGRSGFAALTRSAAAAGGAVGSFSAGGTGLTAPLVLDLDGDGIEIKRRKSSRARFDMDGNGRADDTGWIGRGDGFLVVDLDGDGRVGGRAELSLLGLKSGATSALDALATLDSNDDGRIDSADTRFGEVKVWRDRNGNGASEAGELSSLASHGIASISLTADRFPGRVRSGGNMIVANGAFTRSDGSSGMLAAAALAFKPTGGGTQSLDALTTAVRATGGQDFARFISAPDSLNIFDLLEAEAAAPAGGGAAVAAALDDPVSGFSDARLAQMVQQMASFGARGSENDWKDRQGAVQSAFDYFAG